MEKLNVEKYLEELTDIGEDFAVNITTGKPTFCFTECDDCEFSKYYHCDAGRVDWLFDVYKKFQPITEREKDFLTMLPHSSFIVKNENGTVFFKFDKLSEYSIDLETYDIQFDKLEPKTYTVEELLIMHGQQDGE